MLTVLTNVFTVIGLCVLVGLVGGVVFGLMTDDVPTALSYGLGIGAAAGAVFGFVTAFRTKT